MIQRRERLAVPECPAFLARSRAAGFTLIELSVVLVIIGLIVGGVLVGQDLIKAAQVRATVTQIEAFTTATNTFQTKFNCLPGDCLNAVSLGLGQTGGPGDNGNGDGLIAYTAAQPCFIGGTSNGGTGYAEALNFWYHLQQAQMISGSYDGYAGEYPDFSQQNKPQTTMPVTKLGTSTMIIPTTFGCPAASNPRTSVSNGFWLIGPSQHSASGTGTPALQESVSSSVSQQIDSKLDDGLPLTGNVGGTTGIYDPSLCGTAAPNNCDTCNVIWTNNYNLAGNGMCGIYFINRF